MKDDKLGTGEERVITSACSCHCGGVCMVKVHVRDGVITRIESAGGEEPQLRPCLRGRAYRQRIYSPERLKFPLRRTGTRGEGKFQRITWDEALDTLAAELKRVKEMYGPAAILFTGSGGDWGMLDGIYSIRRLLSMMGGYTTWWGAHSNEGGAFANIATFGTARARSTVDDLLHSRLIILWGWNPAVSITGVNASWYLALAREAGIRIISVDPRYTESTAAFAGQWIPIRPGTDAAMLIGMAFTIISENLQDQRFLDKYTIGFDYFRDYVLGVEDGKAKTPAWAEAITGVPGATIQNLAREYATTKPAALMAGIGPGRTAYGEQYHRAAITLSAMAGNIGIHGGSSGGMVWACMFGGYPFFKLYETGGQTAFSIMNPLDKHASIRKYALRNYGSFALNNRVHWIKFPDAILRGKAGGYPADFKLLYIACSAFLNQHPNINKAVRALKKLEFIVVHEQFMTPEAMFADIVLPTSSLYERNDITAGHVTPPFYAYMRKVVDPPEECKSHLEIGTELAARLDIPGYSDKTEEEWIRELIENTEIPDYDTFKEQAMHKVELPEPYVAFQEQIEDPIKHPFPTPSGKIEIHSQEIADMNHPRLPPIPKYIETWESRNDSLAKKYPLQLITTHFKRRAHSQFENVSWLRELQAHALLINDKDATFRDIKNGDTVRVFNDRGETVLPACVTEWIMPGVVDIPEGAWYDPDEKGVDREGNPNILTKDEPSPAGVHPYNTCLVQVEKG